MPVLGASAEPAKKPRESDYDLFNAFIDAVDQVERNYATKVDRRELIDSAIRGMLSKLDPYSTYIAADECSSFAPGC